MQALIITRGCNSNNELSTLWNDQDTIKKCLNPVEWNPFAFDFWSSKNALNCDLTANKTSTKTHLNKMVPVSLTFAVNRNKCVEYLKEVRDKSILKYANKAYLHWYLKFNVGIDHFENAFENIQNVIDSIFNWYHNCLFYYVNF